MRTPLLVLSCLGLFAAANAQTVLYTENFDGFTVGADISQSNPVNWSVWPGGGDQVVSTDQANSGANSMGCISTDAAAGGPGDLLLLLGDKTTGSYALSWWMYIPAGNGGYFNIQHTEDVATPSFAAEVIFEDAGVISGMANNVAIAGTYPQGAWFQVNLFIDLANVTASFLIGTTIVATWPFDTETDGAAGPNQLGAIDFYSFGGGAPTLGTYYVDDLAYLQIPIIGISEIAGPSAFSVYPVPSSNTITIANDGSNYAAQWRLMDMSGREVLTSSALVLPGSKSVADISSLAMGAYTMELTHGDMRERHTVVRN
ncbi:MAG: T9SS type A sorting domain-containing protein [Flavobacteriales bacterium]